MAASSARLEDAGDLVDEAGEIRITVGGLDIQHDVEAGIRERQPLGVADLEAQPGDLVTDLTVADALRVQVQTDILGGLMGPGEIGRAATMAAADLEHAPPTQFDRATDMFVKLDVRAVRLIRRVERQPRGGGILERVIQEVDALRANPTREEGVPPGPELLAELRADEDLLDEAHQDQTPCSTKAFVAAADQPRLATGLAGLGCGTLAYVTRSPSKASRARVSA